MLNAALARKNDPSDKDNGYIVAKGYDEQLDSLRDIKSTAQAWLANLEQREREATGIKTLKVNSNRVFGYYIEVSKSLLDKVPYRYQRRQTLVNAERFVTDELKEIETRILTAHEEATALENRIFDELKSMTLAKLAELRKTARAVAALDVLQSFAAVAVRGNYVRPVIGKKVAAINIRDGRHPVVETLMEHGAYVPNDTLLDSGGQPYQDSDRSEHGGQEHLHAAGRAHHPDGAHRFVRAGKERGDHAHGQDLHPYRRKRRPHGRTVYFYGGDDRGGDDTELRHVVLFAGA